MNGAPYGSYIHDFVMESCFELFGTCFSFIALDYLHDRDEP